MNANRPDALACLPMSRRTACLALAWLATLPAAQAGQYTGGQTNVADASPMPQPIPADLAPHGVLRAAINMSNFLLVTSRAPNGDPAGVSPDMARAIADKLGVPVKYVPFPKPGELADAVGTDQ